MPIIVIPAPFRGPTGGRERIETAGRTIGACLTEAEARFPGLHPLLVDAQTGGVHRFVKLFLNRELLGREPAVLAQAVAADDEIEILAAIGGG